jgi:hypothetical protein
VRARLVLVAVAVYALGAKVVDSQKESHTSACKQPHEQCGGMNSKYRGWTACTVPRLESNPVCSPAEADSLMGPDHMHSCAAAYRYNHS